MASYRVKQDFRKSYTSHFSRSASNNQSPKISTPKRTKHRKTKTKTNFYNQSKDKIIEDSDSLVTGKEVDDTEDHKKQSDLELDPLNSVEIKSAAQWKAISKKITWKEEESADEERLCLEQKIRTHRNRKYKPRRSQPQRPITLKFPDLEDYPEVLQSQATTLRQLRSVCWRVKPGCCRDARLFQSMFGRGWGVDCDEILSGVYIGDKASVMNIEFLKKQNISTVLNAAEGKGEGKGMGHLSSSIPEITIFFMHFCKKITLRHYFQNNNNNNNPTI